MNSLNLQGPLAQTGYGYVAYNIAREAIKAGYDLKTFPIAIGETEILNRERADEVNDKVQDSLYSIHSPSINPISPTLKVWHQHDLHTRVGNGRYAAYSFFELNRLSALEVAHLTCPDILLTPSAWSKDIIQRDVGRTAHVIHPGVDTSIFFPCQNTHRNQPYTFINIGKWEVRKGHDILVEAFNDAFTLKDNVRLVRINSATNLYTRQEIERWADIYKSSSMTSKIEIINNVKNHVELSKIIQQANCGIFPSRAEGWNMEILECMACGLDVITTNYSAHTEYCTIENSKLINCEVLETAKDGKFFFGQGEWMKFTHDNYEQLIAYMRHVYNNPAKNEVGIKTAENFSWNQTFSQIKTYFLENA